MKGSGYNQLIAKLQRLSVDAGMASDIRRLAVDAYLGLQAARDCQPTTPLKSLASYINLYGTMAKQMRREHESSVAAERRSGMARARAAAERFLVAWNL